MENQILSFDIPGIMSCQQNRYPMLFIDRITECVPLKYAKGYKLFSYNEWYFHGYETRSPKVWNVVQIEAMAQVGGIFALSKVEEPHLYSTYFMKINNVKFKQKVVPGDSVVFELTLMSPIRRGLVEMSGKAYVNGKEVAESEMLAQIVKDRV